MSSAAAAIFEQATQLSDAEYENLYEKLGSHLHRHEVEEPLSDEMKSTFDRRWDEIVSGKVQCRDAFEVLSELRAKYNV